LVTVFYEFRSSDRVQIMCEKYITFLQNEIN